MEGLHFVSDVLFLYINQYTVTKLYKDINKKKVSLLILQKNLISNMALRAFSWNLEGESPGNEVSWLGLTKTHKPSTLGLNLAYFALASVLHFKPIVWSEQLNQHTMNQFSVSLWWLFVCSIDNKLSKYTLIKWKKVFQYIYILMPSLFASIFRPIRNEPSPKLRN